MFFMFFYLQINVFNIYAVPILGVKGLNAHVSIHPKSVFVDELG